MKNKLKLSLQIFKDWLIPFLKGAAVKAALKKLLGSAVMGGFKGWLIKFVVTELFEEIAEPLIKAGLNHVGYLYDKVDGNVKVKRIERARSEDDHDTYRATVNDGFNN